MQEDLAIECIWLSCLLRVLCSGWKLVFPWLLWLRDTLKYYSPFIFHYFPHLLLACCFLLIRFSLARLTGLAQSAGLALLDVSDHRQVTFIVALRWSSLGFPTVNVPVFPGWLWHIWEAALRLCTESVAHWIFNEWEFLFDKYLFGTSIEMLYDFYGGTCFGDKPNN